MKLLTVKGDPLRDRRKHTISIFYLVEIGDQDVDLNPKGGDDA